MTGPYDDIIRLSRPKSRRAKMSAINRAAQFAPFAALSGHEAAIQETGRLTGYRKELDENEKALLNRTLCELAGCIETRPRITVTYFVPDWAKDGGSYETFTGRLKKIDAYGCCLCFEENRKIDFVDICKIQAGICVDIL